MPEKLTARRIEALHPPAQGRIEVRDIVARGLTFRIAAAGSRVWSLYVKINGVNRRYPIGDYPAVSLADARDRANKLRAEVRAGRDPSAERRKAVADKAAASALTVGKVLEAYDRLHLGNLRDGKVRGRILRVAMERHAGRPISEMTRPDLQAAIDAKAATAPVAANRLKTYLCHFANWSYKRGYITAKIGSDLDKAVKEQSRDRVLSLDELGAIWKATYKLDPAYGAFFRLLTLTAQRVSDVADMTWSEVDANRWSIPSRTKNGRPHIVHLTAPACAEIEALRAKPRPSEAPPLVLLSTPNHKRPKGGYRLTAFWRMKKDLDRLCGVTEHWTIHDLRTAFATHVSEAGVPENIADRVLNHAASASRASVVARTYQRSELLPQRAQALERWTDIVLRAAGEREPVVVELHR